MTNYEEKLEMARTFKGLFEKFNQNGYVNVRYAGEHPEYGEQYYVEADPRLLGMNMQELMTAGVDAKVGINFTN